MVNLIDYISIGIAFPPFPLYKSYPHFINISNQMIAYYNYILSSIT